ncbi:RDD family protein [Chitinilyticum piscinae]|uniref:RDD family protein n=1 Tax=Chitinilyticum piscinae TaxID=2866724 RepID=A0A8J7K1G5_9NEIS|nr:RDD family protein [Chitinilyticum piscinae]MBE9609161.1 RDD family protein [Chitinilyticum piscinae]
MLDGHLHLQTPEGITLPLTPAGPPKRALAWLLDFIFRLLLGLFMVFLINLPGFSGRLETGLMLLVAFLLLWAYPVLFEIYGSGMTPGKRIVGIQVVRDNGLPIGWREGVLRNLLRAADFLPMWYGLGLVAMLLNSDFRRLGDVLAGTLVVYRPQKKKTKAMPTGTPRELPFPLKPEEQHAILDFVERSGQLPPARRFELANLAEPLTACTGQASLQRLQDYAAGLTGNGHATRPDSQP